VSCLIGVKFGVKRSARDSVGTSVSCVEIGAGKGADIAETARRCDSKERLVK
jgi:hypothetical protein